MGNLVDAQITEAVWALTDRDVERAQRVVEADRAVNHMELAIDERCIRMLALRQPEASDLRFVAAALKMVTDLERIGDLAVNMAQRVPALTEMTGGSHDESGRDGDLSDPRTRREARRIGLSTLRASSGATEPATCETRHRHSIARLRAELAPDG